MGAANGSVSGNTLTAVVNLSGYVPPLAKVSSTKNAVHPFAGPSRADPGIDPSVRTVD